MAKIERTVRLDTFPVTVKALVDEFVYTIDLDADYQRERIWSTSQQQLLLDSIVSDIDIPKLYLAKVEDNKQFDYECIDGKQRMVTLVTFLKPEPEKSGKAGLTLQILNREYTFQELKHELPKIAQKIESYKLDFVSYDLAALEDASAERLIREIFLRLQLGTRLNSGERLKALLGTVRDFVFREMGNNAPFFRNTSLSAKRFSREFTLAQLCLNSFKRKESGEFGRARLLDLEDFFNEKANIAGDDPNLSRIRAVLKLMEDAFGVSGVGISSRAVAVSAYLFSEALYLDGKQDAIPRFAEFFVRLLDEIKRNMELIKKFKNAENPFIMEGFQKYVLQASVEPSSIRRRQSFLESAFAYYLNPKTRSKIISGK